MSRPNLDNQDLQLAYDTGDSQDVLKAMLNALHILRADFEELRSKMSTYQPGDAVEVSLAHLTLALAAFKDVV